MNTEGAETVATCLVCVFVHTAEDAMNERRSGVCARLMLWSPCSRAGTQRRVLELKHTD